MPSRRFHPKTRTGCVACKRRCVKCDEVKPSCRNCVRRSESCIYPWTGPSPPQLDLVLEHQAGTGRFHGVDLVLMHRYATRTSSHLFLSPEANIAWKEGTDLRMDSDAIVQHGALALASLDPATTAYMSPTQKAQLRERGIIHQQLGIARLRELYTSLDTEELQATCCFSHMLSMIGMAQLATAEPRPSLNDVLKVLVLSRGPKDLTLKILGTRLAGRIGYIFGPRATAGADLLRKLSEPSSDPAYSNAHEIIDCARAEVERYPLNMFAMCCLPALAPPEFWICAQEHKHEALMILLQYALILKHYRNVWWIGKFSTILESAISDVLQSDNSRTLSTCLVDRKI